MSLNEIDKRVCLRRALAAGASALVLAMWAGPALAQDEPDDDEAAETAADGDGEPIVVTGSRIVTNVGLNAPTPVTAVAQEELKALSPTTLISALSQLPQFYGNNTNDVRSGFFSSPGAGNLNLRGLNTGGSGRTLTLLDGRRVVPATGLGSVDINILPSALIQRIETVTGGASAAYGTDAVAGAVNFILDTKYDGWQVSAQAGITSRGDHDNYQISGAWGTDLGESVHLLVSGEYYHADRIVSFEGRDWYQGWSLISNPLATAANPYEPRYIARPNVVSSIATFGGLICGSSPSAATGGTPCNVPTTSALYRRYFRPDGTLAPFVLGEGTATSAHSITNGGSGDDATADLVTLAPEAQRASGFVYLDFDATPNLNLYVQGLAGQSMTDQPDHGGRFAAVTGLDTRITIYRENPFLPAAVTQIMDAEHLTSFQMNVVGSREGMGRDSRLKQDNHTYSGTAGFKFEVPQGLLEGWHVDGYGQYGTADNRGYQQGVLLDRVAAATDAVVDPATGKTVCHAALVNPAKWGSCVPINLFGEGNASAAAIAYVTQFTPGQTITSPLFFQPDGYESGETVTFTSGLGKVYNTRTTQIVADLAASGEVWEGWAGPITAAFGVSYRDERIRQIVYDPSAPASDPSIFAARDPALRGVPVYTLGRFSMIQNSGVANVHGGYKVKEAFTEWQVPLLREVPLVDELNLLAAARYAEYTGSGGVWSWKTGLDWQVFRDLRLRGTISRDVRAATLLERFNRTGGVGTVTKDPAFPNEGSQTFSGPTGGNPELDPETSKTFTYGLVYQPGWLPGASLSLDYWKVDISGAIGALGFQRIVDDCFASPGSSVCSLVDRDPVSNRLVQVRNISQNIAAAAGRGWDVEVGYRRPITLFGGDENVSFRLFWSHLIENSTTTDRTKIATYFDSAGQTGVGNLPEDAVTAIQTYDLGRLNFALTERYISSGIYNKRFNLPGARPDVLDNTVPSVIYVNLSGSYSWDIAGGSLELFGNVQNLFDRDPPILPGVFDSSLGQTGSQYNQGLFDLLGRRFTIGVRFKH
jgi:outer membrane receptor protein involved in Fe transport